MPVYPDQSPSSWWSYDWEYLRIKYISLILNTLRICIKTNFIDDSRTHHTWIKKNLPFIDHINILSIKLCPRFITVCQWYGLLGHTSNNLSLRLKSIDYKSKSHLLKVDFHFRLAQLLSQWVCYIVRRVYSSHLDMFFFEVVTYDMKSLLDVFRFLMRPQLLSKCYSSIVVAVQRYGIRCHNFKFCNKLLEPEAFLCSIRSSDIFSFYGRICYDGLLETLSADCATIACEHIS